MWHRIVLAWLHLGLVIVFVAGMAGCATSRHAVKEEPQSEQMTSAEESAQQEENANQAEDTSGKQTDEAAEEEITEEEPNQQEAQEQQQEEEKKVEEVKKIDRFEFPIKPDVQDMFKEALEFAEKDPQRGADEFLVLVRQNPDLYQAYNNLGVLEWRMGNTSKALDYFHRAIGIEPLYFPAIRNIVRVLLYNKRFDPAVAFLDGLIDRHPESIRLKLIRAEVRSLRNEPGDVQDAIDVALQIAKKDERNFEARYVLALAYFQLGKYELADMVLDTALTLHTEYPEAIFLRGLIYYRQKKIDNARAQFEKLITVDDSYPNVRNVLGVFLLGEEKFQQALEYFDRAIMLDPRMAFAYLNKGTALRALGKYDEALEFYKKALEIDPGLDAAVLNIGVWHMEKIFEGYDVKQTPSEISGSINTLEELDKIEKKIEETKTYLTDFLQRTRAIKDKEKENRSYARALLKELKQIAQYIDTARKRIKDRMAEEEEMRRQQEEERRQQEEEMRQQQEQQQQEQMEQEQQAPAPQEEGMPQEQNLEEQAAPAADEQGGAENVETAPQNADATQQAGEDAQQAQDATAPPEGEDQKKNEAGNADTTGAGDDTATDEGAEGEIQQEDTPDAGQ